ncbi:hypothetical protein K4F52_002028 [Lecanicillium sp. MT-2017a]|nr:hypothetical protein K4F52_002028 [Lecanicillium sp. MT-2017a]
MASSNPFRKSTVQPEEARFPPLDAIDTTQTHTPPPRTSFREAEPAEEASEAKSKDTKPVKRVRVLTPPPLSPDSPEWPSNVPRSQPGGQVDDSDSDDPDPFDGSATDESDRDGSTATPTPPQQNEYGAQGTPGSGPPVNPFSKTLQDMESSEELEAQRKGEGEALKAANAEKTDRQTLNVDAFKRLLMTGNSGVESSQASSDAAGPTQAWTPLDDAQAHDRTSFREPQGPSPAPQQGKDKKAPPPPPSSRHGKTIKNENYANIDAEEANEKTETGAGDASKPLPQTPVRGSLDSDSWFDAESAGKQPDNIAQDTAASSSKKPAPAPPPRRGHGRTDTKTNISNQASTGQSSTLKPTDDDPSSRSSIDSTTARPDPARPNAPAPPPPRRPHAATKQSSAVPSPAPSSSSVTQARPRSNTAESTESNEASAPSTSSAAKQARSSAAPPVPPARNSSSTRRPQSTYGAENAGRRTSGEGRQRDSMPPPPPPRRQTGNQQGSGGRKTSSEAVVEPNPGAGADILADLDALQREVDALRGKMN